MMLTHPRDLFRDLSIGDLRALADTLSNDTSNFRFTAPFSAMVARCNSDLTKHGNLRNETAIMVEYEILRRTEFRIAAGRKFQSIWEDIDYMRMRKMRQEMAEYLDGFMFQHAAQEGRRIALLEYTLFLEVSDFGSGSHLLPVISARKTVRKRCLLEFKRNDRLSTDPLKKFSIHPRRDWCVSIPTAGSNPFDDCIQDFNESCLLPALKFAVLHGMPVEVSNDANDDDGVLVEDAFILRAVKVALKGRKEKFTVSKRSNSITITPTNIEQ